MFFAALFFKYLASNSHFKFKFHASWSLLNLIVLHLHLEISLALRVMFGSNHLYVLHHPLDPEILKKKEEAKQTGESSVEGPPTYETAQEEIAKNSGFYGGLQDKGNKSKGTPALPVLRNEKFRKTQQELCRQFYDLIFPICSINLDICRA